MATMANQPTIASPSAANCAGMRCRRTAPLRNCRDRRPSSTRTPRTPSSDTPKPGSGSAGPATARGPPSSGCRQTAAHTMPATESSSPTRYSVADRRPDGGPVESRAGFRLHHPARPISPVAARAGHQGQMDQPAGTLPINAAGSRTPMPSDVIATMASDTKASNRPRPTAGASAMGGSLWASGSIDPAIENGVGSPHSGQRPSAGEPLS